MRRTLGLFFALFLLMAAPAAAQQQTSFLAWDIPASQTYVAAGTQTTTADAVALTAPIACSGNTSASTVCKVQLPATAVTPGAHVYTVTFIAESVERTTTLTIDPSKGKQPGGLRIEVRTTVTVVNP